MGNLLAQIQKGQLTDKEVQRLLSEGENQKIQARLNALKADRELIANIDTDGDNEGPGPGPGTGGDNRKPWRRKGPIRPKTPPPKDRVWWKHVNEQPPPPPPPPAPTPRPRSTKTSIATGPSTSINPTRKTLGVSTGSSTSIYPKRPKATVPISTQTFPPLPPSPLLMK